MNRRQEILLWVAGIVVSLFIYFLFDRCIWALEYTLAAKGIDTGLDKIEFNYLIKGDVGRSFALLFKYMGPFVIISGLLYTSLRTRNK